MRPALGFISALSTSAIIFVLFMNFADGSGLAVRAVLILAALSFAVGSPALLVGGIPIWLAFRRYRIVSAGPFVCAGAALGLITFLAILGLGPLSPYDPPETFLQALFEREGAVKAAAVLVAGSAGGIVFWLLAVRPSQARNRERSRIFAW